MELLLLPGNCCRRFMRTCVATVFSFVVLTSQLYSQSIITANTISNSVISGGDISAMGSTVDASGNIYIVGWFKNTVDMAPGATVSHLTSNGMEDIYIAKYNATGALLWARSFGAKDQDIGKDVAVDASGNVYVTGYYQGTVDMDPGVGVSKFTSNGNHDIFLAKYSSSGDFIFCKSIGGINNDTPASIALDGSGNVYLGGTLTSPEVDFDPGPGVANLTRLGSIDTWLARFDNNGNYVWAFNIGGTSAQASTYKMTLSAGNALFITGSISGGTVDMDPGSGTVNLTSSAASDIFLAKYDLSGVYQTSFVIGGTGYDIAYGMASDASGNIYLTGKFEATVDFNPGAAVNSLTSLGYGDIFLAKYNASGVYQFAKSMGNSTSDEIGLAVITDAANNPIVGGYFNNVVDFDPTTTTTNLTSKGSRDAFIAKYTSSGALTWARSFGSTGLDQVAALVSDASSNVFAAGTFQQTVDINPGAAVLNVTAPGNQYAAYLLKLNNSGNFALSIVPEPYLQSSSTQLVGATFIDAANNYYVAGSFSKTVDFDPGPGVTSLTAQSYMDFFLAKYNAAGALVFVKTLGNTDGGLQANGLAVDASGNIFIAGRFQNTLDIDPGAGVVNVTGKGGIDIFILKLNSSGNYVASATFGGTSYDAVNGLALDKNGGVYVIGQYYGTVDFDPSAATNSLTSVNNFGDIFIAKYNSNLAYVYAKSIGGVSSKNGNDIAVDDAGNVYAVGTFYQTVDFDPGPSTYNLTSFSNTQDLFILKLNNTGNFEYAIQVGADGMESANVVTVDNKGYLYVGGNFYNTVDFGNGPATRQLTSAGQGDAFIAKYDVAGNFINATSFGGAGNEVVQKLKLDADGNIYAAGSFTSSQLNFFVYGPVTYINEGDQDIFVAVFSPNLKFQAGRSVGGPQTDVTGALSLDAAGNIYLTGSYTGAATVDNLSGAAAYPFRSVNYRDVFMLKFGVPSILPVTLEKFAAIQKQAEVLASWTVSSQINNSHFDIERSADGQTFTSIGRVAGCANCQERIDYQYTDKQPLPGVSYYRLKQSDIDGTPTYSKIVKVNFQETQGKLSVYPTVTPGDFTLSYVNKSNREQTAIVRLINTAGNTVYAARIVFKPGTNTIPMSVANYTPGSYYVNMVLNGTGATQTTTVIKQR